MNERLLMWVADVLGAPPVRVADRSWPDGKSSVYELRDGEGVSWFVKQHHDPASYSAELFAYRRWVSAVADRAPVLRAHDDSQLALVVSAVPSSGIRDWRDDDIRRDAGALLRRFHTGESFGLWDDIAAVKQAAVEQWVRREDGLLARREVDFVSGCATALASLPKPARVPCHRDYTPRNWVIDNGRVQVIDFEDAGADAWLTDIGRVTIGYWRDEPHLTDAFLDGYGRRLSTDEVAVMTCCRAEAVLAGEVIGTGDGGCSPGSVSPR